MIGFIFSFLFMKLFFVLAVIFFISFNVIVFGGSLLIIWSFTDIFEFFIIRWMLRIIAYPILIPIVGFFTFKINAVAVMLMVGFWCLPSDYLTHMVLYR